MAKPQPMRETQTPDEERAAFIEQTVTRGVPVLALRRVTFIDTIPFRGSYPKEVDVTQREFKSCTLGLSLAGGWIRLNDPQGTGEPNKPRVLYFPLSHATAWVLDD